MGPKVKGVSCHRRRYFRKSARFQVAERHDDKADNPAHLPFCDHRRCIFIEHHSTTNRSFSVVQYETGESRHARHNVQDLRNTIDWIQYLVSLKLPCERNVQEPIAEVGDQQLIWHMPSNTIFQQMNHVVANNGADQSY
jgi:hypothetical protein